MYKYIIIVPLCILLLKPCTVHAANFSSVTGYAVSVERYHQLKEKYGIRSAVVIELPSELARLKNSELKYDRQHKFILNHQSNPSVSYFSTHKVELKYLQEFIKRASAWPDQRESQQETIDQAIHSEANFSVLDLIITPNFMHISQQKNYIKSRFKPTFISSKVGPKRINAQK